MVVTPGTILPDYLNTCLDSNCYYNDRATVLGSVYYVVVLYICNTCGVSNVRRGSVGTLTVTSNSHSERDFTVKPEQLNQNQV